jgi:uncharacterized protein YaaQ
MWFASHLYRHGLITADEIVEALIRQSDHRIPLGRLALESKKLTLKQVAKVLAAQTEEGQRFGQLAVRMGFLSEHDVAYLLMVQNNRLPSLTSVLIEMGALDRETADREFHNARRVAAVSDELLMAGPHVA